MILPQNADILKLQKQISRQLPGHEEMVVMKKVFGKEMIVLWVSLASLVFAAMSLNDSLNQLAEKE